MAAYVGPGGAPVSAYQLGLAAGVPLEQLTPTQLAQLQGFQVPNETVINGVIFRSDQMGSVQLDANGQPLELTPSMISTDFAASIKQTAINNPGAWLASNTPGWLDGLLGLPQGYGAADARATVASELQAAGDTFNAVGTAAHNLSQQPPWVKFAIIGGVAFLAIELIGAVK